MRLPQASSTVGEAGSKTRTLSDIPRLTVGKLTRLEIGLSMCKSIQGAEWETTQGRLGISVGEAGSKTRTLSDIPRLTVGKLKVLCNRRAAVAANPCKHAKPRTVWQHWC